METRKTAIPERFSLSRSLCLVHTRETLFRICCSKMSKSDPFFVSESEELERPLPLTRVSGANIKEKEVNRGALNK